MNFSRLVRRTGAALTVVSALFGCGSSANDQGISFSLSGFAALDIDENGAVTCSLDQITNSVTTPIGLDGDGTATGTIACLILQNNMTSVSVRSELADISYFIPGAEEQPPATSAPAFAVLAPITVGDTTTGTGTGDGTTTTETTKPGVGSKVTIPINIVPPEITSWINLNRNKLPEPPFSMDIIVRVSGVTTAGDQLVTNEGFLQGQVVNDFEIGGDDTTGTDDGTTDETTTDEIIE